MGQVLQWLGPAQPAIPIRSRRRVDPAVAGASPPASLVDACPSEPSGRISSKLPTPVLPPCSLSPSPATSLSLGSSIRNAAAASSPFPCPPATSRAAILSGRSPVLDRVVYRKLLVPGRSRAPASCDSPLRDPPSSPSSFATAAAPKLTPGHLEPTR